jgi:hypothetical protein
VPQIKGAANLFGAADGEHWKQLLAGGWMATDATGLKVIVPKLPGSHNGHLEVYRRNDLVVFQYETHKGAFVSAVYITEAKAQKKGLRQRSSAPAAAARPTAR